MRDFPRYFTNSFPSLPRRLTAPRNDGAISRFLAGILIATALLGATAAPSRAQETQAEIRLADEAQEQRARELFRELRCEVCEGQTIADSNAPLAQDMRAAVRTKVASGESDEHILGYFSERYGRDILMRPPMDASTAPLWAAPLFVVLLGAWFIMRYFSRRKASHF